MKKTITIKSDLPYDVSDEMLLSFALLIEKKQYDQIEKILLDNRIDYHRTVNGSKTEYSFVVERNWSWKL